MKTEIKLAREAGFIMENSAAIQAAERFAELVRADERARVAEQPTQPQQEPVAFVKGWNCGRLEVIVKSLNQKFEIDQPLYTSPPASKPKTEEFIKYAWANSAPNIGFGDFLVLFRAIEAYHNIKEKNT